MTRYQVTHALYRAAFRGVLDVPEITSMLEQRGACSGVRTVFDAIEMFSAGSAGTRSRTEDYLLDGIIQSGIPVPLVNQAGATGVPGLECDFVWPARRVVLEVDGRQHLDQPSALILDPERTEALVAAGWRVIRVTGDRVWRDRRAVVAQIGRALGVS